MAKLHNHPSGFELVTNKPPWVLILQIKPLRFLVKLIPLSIYFFIDFVSRNLSHTLHVTTLY
jgi:hypothetical protein